MKTKSPHRFLGIILLVISVSFLLGGVSLAYLMRMEWTYQHRSERFSEEGGGQLRLSQKEFQAALYRSDELVFQGRMFDIREVKKMGNDVIVIGHFDDEDSFLLDWLKGKHRSDQKEFSVLGFFFQYQSSLPVLSFLVPSMEFAFPEHDMGIAVQLVLGLLRPPAVML